ncbi:hypothetical protein [Oceanobacillus chungangensis]|uniref:Uncharacterized protein n=1 Tax=Oceanobacillus chungangensis TaxID=1229152 RepID=A0A3D8PXI0_9BACI|nr:hypothetical protein [Oceanobacillus chungangensis]RDW19849.1 hypothetical protein CWR45_07245 [Oceanobacillus chungangensis]
MGDFVRNCRLCDLPMKSSPFTMCPACLTDSNKVQNLVNKDPLVSIEEIAQFTSVPIEKIVKLVKLGHHY